MRDDLISRQTALDALAAIADEVEDGEGFDYQRWCDYFSDLPSAQKTGRWEIYIISGVDGEGCKCSECGFEGAPYWDYCPNCGAKMEETE